MSRSKAAPKVNTQEEIVRVATDLFTRYGYNGVTFLDIGRILNINHSLVHYHFGSKPELAERVLKDFAARGVRENKIIWANPDTSLLEKFVQARNRIFFRICRYNNSGAIERPVGLISRFSLEMDSIPASMQKIVRNAYATIDGYIVQGVELAVKNGELGADTPTRIVMQLIRSIFFATPLAASISEFKKYDERLYGVLFTIRRAFGTHPAQTMDWPALPPAELEPGG